MKEFELIDWIRGQNAFGADVMIGIGDDAAVLNAKGLDAIAITTDTIMQGVDFIPSPETWHGIGWKALCVSLSDIAAMGLAPWAAVCTLAAPPELSTQGMQTIYRGMKAAADAFACPVIGGDLSTAPAGALTLTSTVLGKNPGMGLKPVARSGAKPGDVIVVSGELGGSLLGRHLTFTPRIELALHLNAHYRLTAMIDISDGLSGDLLHLCDASGAGCRLDADCVPIAPAARQRAIETGLSPLHHALHDGEDFELLFTLAPADWERLSQDRRVPAPLTAIGAMTEAGRHLRLDGNAVPLRAESYEHRFGDDGE